MELPSFFQWQQISKVLKTGEKIAILALVILALASGVFLLVSFYSKYTELTPAKGGVYKEGIVGQTRFINPIYDQINDPDRDLTELIFSGLMSYNKEGGLVKDLAENYTISEDGKTYEFHLKSNIFWHDGQPLTADDIVFTIKTIQNSDYKSPLRANWLGVQVEKLSQESIAFLLRTPYSAFLENTTLKIIPKHIWENIPAENFTLSPYNLQPIGAGPFKFKNLKQSDKGLIKSVNLEANLGYHGPIPYLAEISFVFFDKADDLIGAFNKEEIDGFSLSSLNSYDNLKRKGLNLYSFSLPRYFAVFFNIDKSKILADINVRRALNYATNKSQIIEETESGQPVDSPILSDFFSYQPPSKIYEFNLTEAEKLLDKTGFLKTENNNIREQLVEKKPAFQFTSTLRTGSQGKEVEELQKCLAKFPDIYPDQTVSGYFGNSTKEAVIKFQEKYSEDILDPSGLSQAPGYVGLGTRKKLNEICQPTSEQITKLNFTLTTVNQPRLQQTALILKEQWEKIGVELEIEVLDISELKQRIKERNYDSLLFGEVLGMIPDPFAFWHSSQKTEPGLNLSGYENKEVDALLKDARENLNENIRKEKYEKFQDILIEGSPAIFLDNPDYLYLVSSKVKGISEGKIANPAKRFLGIENWHIKVKRTWK